MNASPENSNSTTTITIRPPQLIQSLVGGFNLVANNIYLILLPVALDLLLWFGPHLRVKNLFEPTWASLLAWLQQNGSTGTDPIENMVKVLLDRYNVLDMLSTFPVGLPSQMVGLMPTHTPLGSAPAYEMISLGQFLLAWFGLTLAGFVLGALYFSGVARACRHLLARIEQAAELPIPAGNESSQGDRLVQASMTRAGVVEAAPGSGAMKVAWQTLQVILLVAALLGILAALMVPTMIVTALLSLISPVVAWFGMVLASFSIVWLLVPLIFSPHGIFLYGQNALRAMLNSSRVVRYSLPGTGIFLLTLVVLNQGLGVLWNSAPETTWLALVGILGRAFITTSLLAASFLYYRGGLMYVQSLRRTAIQNI